MAKRYPLKKSAVVFFEGEKNNKLIYLLRQGSLAATSFSHVKGENEIRNIKVSEFFGLKSTLIDGRREETIQVLEDGQAVTFTLPEFNEMLKKNIKVLLQLLISFSNDMLSIHKLIESKMNFGKSLIGEREKILENANHYYNTNSQNLALYSFQRYYEIYKTDMENDETNEVLEKIKTLQTTLRGNASPPPNKNASPT